MMAKNYKLIVFSKPTPGREDEYNKYVPSTVLALKLARLFGKQVGEIFRLEEED
jgi:hypothetical protein